jgi:hypothetical protein
MILNGNGLYKWILGDRDSGFGVNVCDCGRGDVGCGRLQFVLG